jgi:PAS domain S-box-containing protein
MPPDDEETMLRRTALQNVESILHARRRAEQELRESEERYRFLTETIPVHVWTALPDGNLDFVSNQTAHHLGLTPAELLADGWQKIVHADDLPRAIERWTHSLATGDTYAVEFRLRLRSGEYAWHLAQAVAQRSASGAIVRWFGTNTPIEEQREHRRRVEALHDEVASQSAQLRETNEMLERARRDAEEALARERKARVEAETARAQAESANRMKDQFLSTVSHELRTPLNAMLGWATMLRGGKLEPDKRSHAIETIERNARAQVRLIEDLLDLGRILQGKFQLAVGPVEVVRVVEAAIESVHPAAEAKGVRLQRTLDSHATIVGDAERLQQIAWNLLSNAIKFTSRGGRVLVTVRRAPSYVELAVADTGEGIAPEFLPHVFEPFRQADGAISRRTGGLGLGLSIVRSLVELHGGTVAVASEGVGLGATFTVRLPMAPMRAAPREELARTPEAPSGAAFECPAALAKLRVLVIDDEKDTRELLTLVLEQCDAIVTTAGSAREALERLASGRFDVLVSDVGMPDEDGLSMIRRIRQLPADRGGRLPAIALTAYARGEDRAQALRAGFNVHLAKPVDPSELVLVIAAMIANDRG